MSELTQYKDGFEDGYAAAVRHIAETFVGEDAAFFAFYMSKKFSEENEKQLAKRKGS